MEPPLVDADWHAFCQAIVQGIEGQEWEAMHQTLKSKKPKENRKAKVQWAMKEAKDRGEEHYDPNHQK